MRYSLRQFGMAVSLCIGAACTSSSSDEASTSATTTTTTTSSTTTTTTTVPLSCPSGYLLVPGNTSLSTADFCVATYEMRNIAGTATSQAAATPWSNASRNSALASCQSLGARYDLISNPQWQTLARNIAGVGSNWSSGTAGTGYMNIGNGDNGGGGTLCSSTLIYVDINCASVTAAGNFIYKRTHNLSNGGVLWDLGGNNYEMVKDLSTGGQYGAAACANALAPTNPGSDQLGTAQAAFGFASTAGFALDTSVDTCAGLGGTMNSTQNNSVTPYAVIRGGSTYDLSGIFNADIGFADANGTDPAFGFRCVYR
jgi:hypothetical protein